MSVAARVAQEMGGKVGHEVYILTFFLVTIVCYAIVEYTLQ